jgi:hypothetical protein
MKTLEIEHIHLPQHHNDFCLALLQMCTGYEREELRALVPKVLLSYYGWHTGDFRKVLEKLQFNTSPRFGPFDPATEKVCLLRYKLTKRGLVAWRNQVEQEGGTFNAEKAAQYWDLMLYCNGMCYDVNCPRPFPLAQLSDQYRITSMMPVWISSETVIREL